MRIGRDHIASTVYTIAFATAGASLPVLLLIAIYNRPLFQVLQTEQFATELIRTMVGSIGLILAVPLTTAIGVAVVRASRNAKPPGVPTARPAAHADPGTEEPDDNGRDTAEADAGDDEQGASTETTMSSTPERSSGDASGPSAAGEDTTVLPRQTTRLRRRRKSADDDFDFSDLRDPD